ncbi:fasciclin domain-containing protein [Hymenobacter psychrophilus]|uniref:Uncaracterized surface protein containing fasciclin (FAS1) repeats n=1 Tax=Hymenobacter psychrophilus TaxID=651662 RepID=A0A1H3C0L7_9BACT|nr:fasciclin domain-containing protein [Hymenobacter psychrophilus]SDX47174.1 Uncaracterized surface protein containing fasciclin (FAS1) repeats [Hymenobacter psychrophilus]
MHKLLRSSTLALLAAGSLSLGLTSCGDSNTEKADASIDSMTPTTVDSTAMMADDARMGKPEGVMVDGVAMLPSNTIVQNAVMASSVSTLVKAVQAAGLDGTLSGPGPFTVFAPTNAAFDKLPNGALAGLLKPESKDKLAAVLTYHVIPGRLVAQDLKDGQELTTVNGEKLKVMVKDGVVMVGNGKDAPATVQVADVISSNGVTHVIDAVVLPLAK